MPRARTPRAVADTTAATDDVVDETTPDIGPDPDPDPTETDPATTEPAMTRRRHRVPPLGTHIAIGSETTTIGDFEYDVDPGTGEITGRRG